MKDIASTPPKCRPTLWQTIVCGMLVNNLLSISCMAKHGSMVEAYAKLTLNTKPPEIEKKTKGAQMINIKGTYANLSRHAKYIPDITGMKVTEKLCKLLPNPLAVCSLCSVESLNPCFYRWQHQLGTDRSQCLNNLKSHRWRLPINVYFQWHRSNIL